ncbi:MAG TPA: hypothetical protein VFT22_42135 [Kofleriaceae bacterium]|nr:hypothetical protein [Kofleriaceae bacterium]
MMRGSRSSPSPGPESPAAWQRSVRRAPVPALALASVLALGALLAGACNDTATPVGSPLNLNRPVDIAFACYGGMRVTGGRTMAEPGDTVVATAQPLVACDVRSQPPVDNKEPRPPGQEDTDTQTVGTTDWYGFILQSAQGTVAVSRWTTLPPADLPSGAIEVLDADPLTPGNNSISIGEEPVAIATDKSGCYEVTSNAGSCDLSVLDVNSAVIGLKDNAGQHGAVRIDRATVRNLAGAPIGSRPAAMVTEPTTDVVGNACPANDNPAVPVAPTGIAYIAYPSCHVVAAVDLGTLATSMNRSPTVVAAIKLEATGPRLLAGAELTNLSCPAECGSAPDAPQPGIRPATLAYRFDSRVGTRRLAIGADNSATIAVVELGADSLPTAVTPVALQDPTGKLGVTSIALSQQIGMGGSNGMTGNEGTPGGQGQFVYAVASDRTVRVVDVLVDMAHPTMRECDTQVDTRFARAIAASDLPAIQCFTVGGPATPPRRTGAKGPGIELPSDAIPVSVAFITAPPFTGDMRMPGPSTLLGTFAIITATTGQGFLVNVDDDNNDIGTDLFDPSQPQLTAPTLIMPHQLRDAFSNRGEGAVTSATSPVPSCKVFGTDFRGAPRATTPPAQGTAGGPVTASKVPELPTFRQVACNAEDTGNLDFPVSEVVLAADVKTRDVVFPDLRGLEPEETWTFTWEGALSQDSAGVAIDGPPIRDGQMFVDSAASARIEDRTQPFCSMGVEPFDILQMRGCDPTLQGTDCPSGYTCFVHPDRSISLGSTTIGTCMLESEAPRLAATCRDYLISLRRYTIDHADSGELVLRPRQHVLRTTPLDGCVSDQQCNLLADYANQNSSDAVNLPEPPVSTRWQCQADDSRAPVNPDPTLNKRCVQRCAFHSVDADSKDRDADCDPGAICVGATAGGGLGTCMEGVMPPQACVNAPQRFEVRAADAFTVIGQRSGYVHPIIDQGGTCVRDPALPASSLMIGRIPLKAPACDPSADPLTGKTATGFEPNPCMLTTEQVETQNNYVDDQCHLGTTMETPPTIVAHRQAPAIKFRNRGMTLTLVDPYYVGDRTCPADHQGFSDPALATARVPLVFPGYQLSFKQTAGYSPLTLSGVNSGFAPSFPVKVVEGPTNSIFVIDDGDLLATQLGASSLRGQVIRIESSNLGQLSFLR